MTMLGALVDGTAAAAAGAGPAAAGTAPEGGVARGSSTAPTRTSTGTRRRGRRKNVVTGSLLERPVGRRGLTQVHGLLAHRGQLCGVWRVRVGGLVLELER